MRRRAAFGLLLVAAGFAWWPAVAHQATGTVAIAFSEDGRLGTTAVLGTIYYDVRGGIREQSVHDFSRPVEVTSLPPGVYRFAVVAQAPTRALVAERVLDARVTAGETTSLRANLVERRGFVRVVDAAGHAAAGAQFYTRPAAVNSATDEQGRISLATLAAGTWLSVRTLHWGVTCHTITPADAQTVVVPDATDESVIVTPTVPTTGLPQRRQIVPSPLLAGALLEGIPGSDCAVPYEHLPVTLARRGATTEHTLLLPQGAYTLTLADGRVLRLEAPGRVSLR